MLIDTVRGALESWKKQRERRRRLARAPELILRANLIWKDKECRTLQRQLGETRARCEGLERELYAVRQANEELVWARCSRAGVGRYQEESPLAVALAQVAQAPESVAA